MGSNPLDDDDLSEFENIAQDCGLTLKERKLVSHIINGKPNKDGFQSTIQKLLLVACYYKTQSESLGRKFELQDVARKKDRNIILYLTISTIVFALLIVIF